MADPREPLGRLVRDVWVRWATEQPAVKPSWLLPWEELDDGQREVDMRIGEAVAAAERRRLTEPAGTRRCPRDHRKLGRDMAMDRIPLRLGGGWSCPGILLDGSDCGFELTAAGDYLARDISEVPDA